MDNSNKFDTKAILNHWEDKFNTYLPKDGEDISLVTLKGHLIVEAILNSMIKAYCRDNVSIDQANLTFYQKTHIAKALVGEFYPESIWYSIRALNSLRNEIVHTLEVKKLVNKVRKFISIYYTSKAELDLNDVDLSNEISITKEVTRSIAYLIGQLSVMDVVSKFMESQKKYS